MDKLSFTEWQTALVVLLAVIQAYNMIVTAVKNHRSEQAVKDAPARETERRMDAYDRALDEIKAKIERLERKDNERQSESRMVLHGLLALTRHSIDGNNIDGLKSYQAELQTYLVDK